MADRTIPDSLLLRLEEGKQQSSPRIFAEVAVALAQEWGLPQNADSSRIIDSAFAAAGYKKWPETPPDVAAKQNAEHLKFINGLKAKFSAEDIAAHARIRNMLWVLYPREETLGMKDGTDDAMSDEFAAMIVSDFKEGFSDVEFSFKGKANG